MGQVTPAPPLSVTGGSHGLSSTYLQVRSLANAYDAAGDRLRDQAGLGVLVMGNGDLLESAVLAPRTFAEAEAAVLAATTGPHGLLVESLAWEADALVIRSVVEAFETTDALVHGAFEALDYSVGRAIGSAIGAAPVALGAAAVATLAAGLQAPAGLPGSGAGHPAALQHLANGSGGLVAGLWSGLLPGPAPGLPGLLPATPGAEDAAGLLAGLFPDDGSAEVATRPDLTAPGDTTPPGSLAAVLAHLDAVNRWSTADRPENNGTIAIQSWADPGGARHHVVYLPGTDDMTTLPWTMDGDVRDMPTNLLAIGGHSTAYAQGILQAMRAAGIGPDEPVLLAGHSQGGVQAAWIASHSSEFSVVQVVTAGSPIAVLGDYPSDTRVLSLEHHGDVVPLLEGEDNPDRPQHVTVTFDDHGAGLVDSHELAHYIAGAAGVDQSLDPSLVDQLDRLRALGFLTGVGPARSQAFQITRVR